MELNEPCLFSRLEQSTRFPPPSLQIHSSPAALVGTAVAGIAGNNGRGQAALRRRPCITTTGPDRRRDSSRSPEGGAAMEGPTRSRQKNMKRVEAALSPIEEDEGEKFDGCGGPTSRCSVKLIHSVISAFNSEKRRIAASTGFGGLLKFPAICKLNLKLSVWLLLHLDVEKRAIVVDEKKNISLINLMLKRSSVYHQRGLVCQTEDWNLSELAINEIRTRIGMANMYAFGSGNCEL